MMPNLAVAAANALWAQSLACTVLANGSRHVVVSPGSRSTPLVLAFAEDGRAHLHTVLDERAAGFFALGLAKVCGHAVVLVCTSGSAVAHYLPAVVEAALAGVPMLILSADRPLELQRCGAAQTIDQTNIFGTHGRYFAQLDAPRSDGDPGAWQTMAALALDAAEGPDAGPAHLNVPFREPLWIAPNVAQTAAQAALPIPPPQVLRGIVRLSSSCLERLLARFTAAQRGVVVCGPSAMQEDDGAHVLSLAAALNWPVFAEPAAQLPFGPSGMHPCLVRSADALLRSGAAPPADFVLRVGGMPTSKAVGQYIATYGAGCTVGIDPAGRYLDPGHTIDTVLAVPAATFCRDMLPLVRGKGCHQSWLRAWQGADEAAQAALERSCSDGFWSGAVVRCLCAALPEGSALHVASSMAIRDLDTFAARRGAATQVFCNRGSNGIDGTLATLLGEAVAWRHGPVVGLLGDLAFLHDVGSLQLARQLGVQATAVVVNNDGGAIFDSLPISQHASAYVKHFRTPQQADLGALCAAAQVQHWQVSDMPAFEMALLRSFEAPGLSVVEARVQPAKRAYDGALAAVASVGFTGGMTQ